MQYSDLRVSENLSEAHTLPSWLYTDPEVLEFENKEIFSKTWQYVGHISQVGQKGDYFTTEVVGKPLIITHAKDGEIRAFYNVCSHRASKLLEGEGNKSIITCPYHAWTYHLDGSLNRAPNMSGVNSFNHDDFCLKTVRLEINESLIFVNLDPQAEPMSSTFGGLFESLTKFHLENLKKVKVVETVCKSNWKVGIDNYLECDHCPLVHKSLVQQVNMDDYEVTIFDNYIYQGVPLKGEIDSNYKLGKGGRYYWLYPNMWLSFDPGPANLSIHKSVPIDHKTTKYIYTTFLMNETMSKEEEDLLAIDQHVRREDRDICEEVQKGLETGAYTQGRFSLTENCVHHFHLLMQKKLLETYALQK
ncbi:choline monooxygenase [Scopulibacillus darangshiensis]|uniref:Choline monooxygenase n=1 Tax=Scopulibacillus darangshiensis TaxID=442528 RepID=A0A4R2P8U6_9BACL|nr:aromatic ring-hydroxylating dioxygenase subunit alpha [Scopulibacillus darangshiensis]TCP31312.1 choline monooxygenase [Scopulibacillus darangshiensis]